jgi:hypothetical protein
MNEAELDLCLCELLREPEPAADEAFVQRVVAAARLDEQLRRSRRRALRRALIECGAAIAVAATFYLLSQEQPPLPDGMLSLQGPATAGLMMLALWAIVSLPASGNMRSA